MSFFYLDSSAWLKRYFLEPGSARISRLFEMEKELTSSVLGYVEVVSALARQQKSRNFDELNLAEIRKDLKEDWNNLTGLPVTDETVERAVVLTDRHRLRGADAVHLATVLGLSDSIAGLNKSVVFVASDRELLEAARREGLSVEDPSLSD